MADRTRWLERLREMRVAEKDFEATEDAALTRVSLGSSLLALAQIDHEHEYALCRSVAEHLLGAVPEPEDVGDA